MNPRVQRFQREFGEMDLAKYFNLCPEITIQHAIYKNEIRFTLQYLNITRCPRVSLPIELIREVQSYLIDRIEIRTGIIYTRDYPFVAPVWCLLDVTPDPLKKSWPEHTILHYYQDKINQHNHYYNLHWSPAISIVGDILDFIRRVNHFEEMFEIA